MSNKQKVVPFDKRNKKKDVIQHEGQQIDINTFDSLHCPECGNDLVVPLYTIRVFPSIIMKSGKEEPKNVAIGYRCATPDCPWKGPIQQMLRKKAGMQQQLPAQADDHEPAPEPQREVESDPYIKCPDCNGILDEQKDGTCKCLRCGREIVPDLGA